MRARGPGPVAQTRWVVPDCIEKKEKISEKL